MSRNMKLLYIFHIYILYSYTPFLQNLVHILALADGNKVSNKKNCMIANKTSNTN